MGYEVLDHEHGLIVRGDLPVTMERLCRTHFSKPRRAVMLPCLGRFYEAVMVVARDKGAADAWIAEVEEELDRQYGDGPARWYFGLDTGVSSLALYSAISLGLRRADVSLPQDRADFGRCVRMLVRFPGWQSKAERVGAILGPEWAKLLRRWREARAYYKAGDDDQLERLLAECRDAECRDAGKGADR